jgi:hypothetical protein
MKTHCKRKHPLLGDNVFITPDGLRLCATCRRDRQVKKNAKYVPKKKSTPEERKERSRASKARYRNSPKGQAAQKAYYERSREEHLVNMRDRMLSEYGLGGISGYDALLAKQCGRCAICSVLMSECVRRFAVDHNHDTEKVRGLLCFRCNAGIGKFNDDPELLKLAVAYLEAHDGTSGLRDDPRQVPRT